VSDPEPKNGDSERVSAEMERIRLLRLNGGGRTGRSLTNQADGVGTRDALDSSMVGGRAAEGRVRVD
jgi:hypothetical protein